MNKIIINKDIIPKKYLIFQSPIIIHSTRININNINKYAKKSLEIDNDAKKRSKDEAISIHIITSSLNAHLNIIFEKQIFEFYGKPDFIIRLGKNKYIMVSTTRAICKSNKHKFTQREANRLIKKKLKGLSICQNNLECLVDEVVTEKYTLTPILHILSPDITTAQLCINAYNSINITNSKEIKILISIVGNAYL